MPNRELRRGRYRPRRDGRHNGDLDPDDRQVRLRYGAGVEARFGGGPSFGFESGTLFRIGRERQSRRPLDVTVEARFCGDGFRAFHCGLLGVDAGFPVPCADSLLPCGVISAGGSCPCGDW